MNFYARTHFLTAILRSCVRLTLSCVNSQYQSLYFLRDISIEHINAIRFVTLMHRRRRCNRIDLQVIVYVTLSSCSVINIYFLNTKPNVGYNRLSVGLPFFFFFTSKKTPNILCLGETASRDFFTITLSHR